MDPQRQQRVSNFKKFLSYLPNQFIRFDVSRELGFDDIVQDLSSMQTVDCFKIKVNK